MVAYSFYNRYIEWEITMTKQLYLIDYENAHWCGGQLHVVVWAESEDDAVCLAEVHMDQEQRELFSDEFQDAIDEDDDLDNEQSYTVNQVTVLDENNEFWQFYLDEGQRAAFYPTIGEP